MIQLHDKRWVGQFDWFRHKTREDEFYQIVDINKELNIDLNEKDVSVLETNLKQEFHDDTASPVNFTYSQWNVNKERKFVHINTLQCVFIMFVIFVFALIVSAAKDQHLSSHIADFHSSEWQLCPLEKDYFQNHFDPTSFEDIGVELKSELSWREAMLKVQQVAKTGQFKHLRFHPLQRFSYVPEAVAQGKKVIVLLLHVDGLQTGHHYTQNRGVVTVGYQIVNVKIAVKRHHFYVRIGIIPKSIYWENDHIFQIVRKDLLALRPGIPVSIRNNPGKFELVFPVLAGVIGDGPELSRFLIKTGLKGYAGHHVCFDNLDESKSSLGSATENVFIPRRWIKNWVCMCD